MERVSTWKELESENYVILSENRKVFNYDNAVHESRIVINKIEDISRRKKLTKNK